MISYDEETEPNLMKGFIKFGSVGHVDVATDADAEVTIELSTDADAKVNKTICNSNQMRFNAVWNCETKVRKSGRSVFHFNCSERISLVHLERRMTTR